MDSAELNQYSDNDSLTVFERPSFQNRIEEKKQTPFTVTKLSTELSGFFTYRPSYYDWSTSTEISKSRRKDDNEYLINEDS